MPFYTKVGGWSKKYANSIGLDGSYGHEFKSIMVPELVNFDLVLVRDGVHGGSNEMVHSIAIGKLQLQPTIMPLLTASPTLAGYKSNVHLSYVTMRLLQDVIKMDKNRPTSMITCFLQLSRTSMRDGAS